MRGKMGRLIDFMHGRLKPENDVDALHIAAFDGDLERIEYLIKQKRLDPNIRLSTVMSASVTTSPIFLAIQEGNPEAAKLLAELGANVNGLNDHMMTPLMEAADSTDLAQVELLLSLGADATYYRKSDFRSALSFSMPSKFLGQRSKRKKERAAHIASLLIDAGAPVEPPPEEKYSDLMNAARENLPLHIELLLAAGADPERKCKLNWAPDWTALDHAINEGSHQARKLLEEVTKTPTIVKKRGTVV